MSQAAAEKSREEPKSALRRFFSLELLDNRYPALHGLRVLAIVSVIQYHITWIFSGEQGIALNDTFREASLSIFYGMDLFFLLSGFLIGSILIRSLEVSGTQNLRRFYLRRIFRTFPSYYVVLTGLALWLPLTAEQQAHLPFEYVYLTNFMPLARHEILMFWGWSLALEEQFYLTVPLLMFVLYRLRTDRARMIALATIALSALVIRLAIYFHGSPWDDFDLYEAVYFRTYTRFDVIVAGILLAFMEMRYGKPIADWLRAPFHRALVGIPCLTLLWLISNPTLFGDEHAQLLHVFAWGTLTSIMYLGAVPLILHGEGPLQRFLGHPIFRRLATVGYGVYLIHIPLIDHVLVPIALRLNEGGASMAWVWPASLLGVTAASFVLGYVMHVLIEKPSLWIRDKVAA
jgi:peptidoglycan/LPS O-acetylase OafA/YrhL